MRKVTFAAATFALLSGCSTVGGWFDRMGDGGNTGARADRTHTNVVARSGAPADPHYRDAYGTPNYAARPYFDNQTWPPVWPNQAFPMQEMHSE